MSETTHIPARIKLARKMAGLETQAKLVEQIEGWKPSRLGNYEAGVSVPSPDDMLLIAKATGASPCWLMFGLGPIRSNHRDVQAIRHQNLTRLLEKAEDGNGGKTALAKALGITIQKLDEHLDNPFLLIGDGFAKKCEAFVDKRSGWMNEQHVEDDPVCNAFPDDMRELMMIFSELNESQRAMALDLVKIVSAHSRAADTPVR